MKTRGLYWILPFILVVLLAVAVWVRAQAPVPQRVEAGSPGLLQVSPTEAPRPGVEGEGEVIVGSLKGLSPAQIQALGGYVPLRYSFSGVADDGLKGVAGKKATSVTCTNTGATATNLIVTILNYDGVTYYSTPVITLSAGQTYTTSTQQTAIFFEDATLNTNAIIQGYGTVRSDSALVICSVQVLDPTGYPPVFVSELELFRQ